MLVVRRGAANEVYPAAHVRGGAIPESNGFSAPDITRMLHAAASRPVTMYADLYRAYLR